MSAKQYIPVVAAGAIAGYLVQEPSGTVAMHSAVVVGIGEIVISPSCELGCLAVASVDGRNVARFFGSMEAWEVTGLLADDASRMLAVLDLWREYAGRTV